MDRFSINLKMKASDAFKDGELTPEQEETLEEEEKEAMIKYLFSDLTLHPAQPT